MSARASSGAAEYAIVIPSLGRPGVLHDTVSMLSDQSCKPAQVILAVTEPSDIDERTRYFNDIEIVISPKGSCVQRNRALDVVRSTIDYVAFLDDDVELAPDYFSHMVDTFEQHGDVVLATGMLLANGNISRPDARSLVRGHKSRTAGEMDEIRSAYGCNMFARVSAMDGLRFDEALPLYGWLEDLDFARTMLRRGRIVRIRRAKLAHLQAQVARTASQRFGFSQIMNSYYLRQKGQLDVCELLLQYWIRGTAANALGSLVPSNRFRRQRLLGNLIAFSDIVRKRINPSRILTM